MSPLCIEKGRGSLPVLIFLFYVCWLLPLIKGYCQRLGQFLRLVVFHLCVDIHCDLALFVTGEILDRFRIHTGGNQVSDIGVTQLMRRHLKIQNILNLPVIPSHFTKLGVKHIYNLLVWLIVATFSQDSKPYIKDVTFVPELSEF